ncbi:MAG TPA: PilZ domain-containing protein [Kofleriaceae bacterium]|nr:PilZ domain-containing protein [Kofleriaceae bacterium]
MGGVKRREHPRFAIEARVDVRTDAAGLSGRTRNLSRGGLCIELDAPLGAGADVEVGIALVFDDDHCSEPLALPACVAWCTPIDARYQVGCQFRRLSPHQAANLDLFLRYLEAAPRAAASP